MGATLQDARFGLRMLSRHPGFTAAALLMLALGIGSNVVVFSLIQTMFFRRLPVPEADRLIAVFGTRAGSRGNLPLSLAEFAYVRDHARSFGAIAAHYSNAPVNLVEGGDSYEINGSVVTAGFFDVLRLRPALGRFFLAAEDRVPGRNPVAVVSYALWRGRFNGDPQVLGRIITLNGTAFTIVGVAPSGFAGVSPGGLATEVWLPSAMFRVGYRYCDALTDPDCRIVRLIGRLAPGVSAGAAAAETATLGTHLPDLTPADRDDGRTLGAEPVQGAARELGPQEANVPLLLGAAVAGVLLIACANLAGLLLARGALRAREVAVRVALGASRGRVFRQLLTEALILAAAGAVAGLLVAFWTKDLLAAFYAFNVEGQRANFSLQLDTSTMAFTAVLAAATVLAFGVAPSLAAVRRDVVPALKHGGASSPRLRVRAAMVACELACAVVLLSSAVLLARSMSTIARGPGYNPEGVVLLRLRPSLVAQDAARAEAYQRQVVDRLLRLPGVVAAAPAAYPPLPGWGPAPQVWRPGHAPVPGQAVYRTAMNAVGPAYLRTIELPLLDGRDFTERDRTDTPRVALVNEVVARTLWPDGDAVGSDLVIDGERHRVIGIVKAAQYHTLTAGPDPLVLVDYWQMDAVGKRPIDSRTHVRVNGNAAAMLPLIRREILSIDSTVPISEDRTLSDWLGYFFRPVRAAAAAVTLFAGLALLLSVIGLYAVVAGTVAQRQREIGLRMALGADPLRIGRWILGQGLLVAVAGAAGGGAAALGVSRLLSAYLYGVGPRDPETMIAAAGVLAVTALAASWVPARRAMTVDPIQSLRE